MEGVTAPSFRDLVLARNPPSALGGACTEFVRVVDTPVPVKVMRRHLGPHRFAQPVSLQLMGSDLECLARSAIHAVAAGAAVVDLNFGCPAKGALRGCAGSAALKDARQLERTVAAVARAIPGHPVTGKIRAGFDDASRVEDLARAVEAGGAWMLTIHCRTRAEAYCDEVDWTRIARAVAAVSIPVCGNGGVSSHADLERLRSETGCAYAMVGRAALGDPWIFHGAATTEADAARFLLDYAEALFATGEPSKKGVAGRLKQLLVHWTAGALCRPTRESWLHMEDPQELFDRLALVAGEARCPRLNPLLAAKVPA
jgi:tRNA-dihydrouridine synthase C